MPNTAESSCYITVLYWAISHFITYIATRVTN